MATFVFGLWLGWMLMCVWKIITFVFWSLLALFATAMLGAFYEVYIKGE